MRFQFTEEDFKRYVTKSEHGGVHIWDGILDGLQDMFGVKFTVVPWERRGDWLNVMWFWPKETSRDNWRYQAMYFLSRPLEDPCLKFGLVIECPTLASARAESLDEDRDGMRLIDRLANDSAFCEQLNALIQSSEWRLTASTWSDEATSRSLHGSQELLEILRRFPEAGGWSVGIERVLSPSEAIALGDNVVATIVTAYEQLAEIWKSVMPEADRAQIEARQLASSSDNIDRENHDSAPMVEVSSFTADLAAALQSIMSAGGLYYTPWQLATFYTALQTKGFVILSGISGTGKTKLAQAFAGALPVAQDAIVEVPDDMVAITIKPYMLKYNRVIIPKHALRLFTPPKRGESKDVTVRFAGKQQSCQLTYSDYENTNYIVIYFKGKLTPWFKEAFEEGDTLGLQPELDEDGLVTGFRVYTEEEIVATAQASGTEPSSPSNLLFLPVRPDWRDSKSLLGYYNPLTGTYQWTSFLRFIMRAVKSYQDGDALTWFVILDEMNLAHVEYYFADLLSILESGRDAAGWTREPLRIQVPPDAEGDLPPKELRLPPNLYIVGTVNVDETTHTFSPKILDRGFTLELTDVDLSAYPSGDTSSLNASLAPEEKRSLLKAFSREGRFARIEKAEVFSYVDKHPMLRDRLAQLNALLQPYDLHLGYRVFDEIVTFVGLAQENGLFSALGGLDAALDAAVLMKVLPKFHGSRGKLESPLVRVLAWCVDPTNPMTELIREQIKDIESADDVAGSLDQLSFRYPRTAAKATRMLWSLYASGFAAFG